MSLTSSASPGLDGRLGWSGTLAALAAAFPSPAFPVGTQAFTADFGIVSVERRDVGHAAIRFRRW
jgi:hypothetical protein